MHDGSNIACLKTLLRVDATYFKDKDGKTVAHVAAEKNATRALQHIVSLRAGKHCCCDAAV